MEAITPISASFMASLTSSSVSSPVGMVTVWLERSAFAANVPSDHVPKSNESDPDPTLSVAEV